jgi:hypothetical protein
MLKGPLVAKLKNLTDFIDQLLSDNRDSGLNSIDIYNLEVTDQAVLLTINTFADTMQEDDHDVERFQPTFANRESKHQPIFGQDIKQQSTSGKDS